MLIYCNGDSFAAGSELADHILYPGVLPPLETVKVAREARDFNGMIKRAMELCKSKKVIDEALNRSNFDVQTIERSLAYPARLGEIFSAEVINSAIGGSSMQSIAYRTIVDLQNQTAAGKRPDIAVIHITSPDRFSWFINYAGEPYSIQSILLSMADSVEEPHAKNLCKLYINNESERERLLRYYYDIVNVKSACTYFGIPTVFVTTIYPLGYFFKSEVLHNSLPTDAEFCTLSAAADLQFPIDLIECEIALDTDYIHPVGHFTKPVSDRFAENIAVHIRKKLNIT